MEVYYRFTLFSHSTATLERICKRNLQISVYLLVEKMEQNTFTVTILHSQQNQRTTLSDRGLNNRSIIGDEINQEDPERLAISCMFASYFVVIVVLWLYFRFYRRVSHCFNFDNQIFSIKIYSILVSIFMLFVFAVLRNRHK